MNLEANKDLARRYVDALNRHDIEAAMTLVKPDLVNHAAIPEAQGADGLRRIMGKLHKAFPDQQVTLDDVMAEGDRVVCRVTMRGTNTGPLEFIRWPLPATGKSMSITAIHVFRLENDKIAEHWGAQDLLGMMRQLGVSPRAEAHS